MLNATLVERRDLAPDLSIMRVLPDAGVPEFIPGQFTRLGMVEHGAKPHVVKRAYSIASAPHEKDALEVCLVKVEGGRMTPGLWELQPGGRLWVDDRPNGDFTLKHVPNRQTLVMIATGTAVAPYVSMLRAEASPHWKRFVVVHGVRRLVDLGYNAELERFAERQDVTYVPIVSRDPLFAGRQGRVQQVFEPDTYRQIVGEPLTPEHTHVYLCGNPEMVKDLRDWLKPLGFSVATRTHFGNLHVERYW
jgi:ferredoxin/flavodoxin---NADP+ reductase